MVAMRFDYRDIFRSARVAFSFQRLWIQFVGLLSGWLAYVLLTYLALLVGGKNLGVIWSRFGLLPSLIGFPIPWYSWIIYALGILVFVYAFLVTSTGVARATYMHLKGNTFYSWKEALSFACKKKGGAVIATPIAILAIAFFTGLGGFVVGLLGRIPVLGPLGISLLTVLWFCAALFLIFVGMALSVSLLLTPSVLATTDDDAFEGIFQSFSTLYSQPWRLILYELLVGAIALTGFGVFAFFTKKAWTVMTTILVWGMGDKYGDLSYMASYLLQNWIYPAAAWSRAIISDYNSLFFFSRDFMAIDLSLVMTVSSWIMAIFLLLIGTYVLSYPLAIFNTGNTLVFLILKKKKDDENLLERKDKEEEDETEADEKAEDESKIEEEKGENKKRPAVQKRATKKKTVRKTKPSKTTRTRR